MTRALTQKDNQMFRPFAMTAILVILGTLGLAGCTNNTGLNAATGAVAGGIIANELSDDNDVATALGVAIGAAMGVDGGRSLY